MEDLYLDYESKRQLVPVRPNGEGLSPSQKRELEQTLNLLAKTVDKDSTLVDLPATHDLWLNSLPTLVESYHSEREAVRDTLECARANMQARWPIVSQLGLDFGRLVVAGKAVADAVYETSMPDPPDEELPKTLHLCTHVFAKIFENQEGNLDLYLIGSDVKEATSRLFEIHGILIRAMCHDFVNTNLRDEIHKVFHFVQDLEKALRRYKKKDEAEEKKEKKQNTKAKEEKPDRKALDHDMYDKLMSSVNASAWDISPLSEGKTSIDARLNVAEATKLYRLRTKDGTANWERDLFLLLQELAVKMKDVPIYKSSELLRSRWKRVVGFWTSLMFHEGEHWKRFAVSNGTLRAPDDRFSFRIDMPIQLRTKRCVTYMLPHFNRVRVFLRLYQSTAEVLSTFDIPVDAIAYDGKRFQLTELGAWAYQKGVNFVVTEPHQPAYEERLRMRFPSTLPLVFPFLDLKMISTREAELGGLSLVELPRVAFWVSYFAGNQMQFEGWVDYQSKPLHEISDHGYKRLVKRKRKEEKKGSQDEEEEASPEEAHNTGFSELQWTEMLDLDFETVTKDMVDQWNITNVIRGKVDEAVGFSRCSSTAIYTPQEMKRQFVTKSAMETFYDSLFLVTEGYVNTRTISMFFEKDLECIQFLVNGAKIGHHAVHKRCLFLLKLQKERNNALMDQFCSDPAFGVLRLFVPDKEETTTIVKRKPKNK